MHASKVSESVILVRLPNWVGDVCMVMPSLALLCQTGCKLLVCGKPFARPLLQALPDCHFIEITGSVLKDARHLRHELEPVDAEIKGLLFPDSLSSALTFKLAGVESAGYRDDGRSLLLRWAVNKPSGPLHAVHKWYALTVEALRRWRLLSHSRIPETPVLYKFKPDRQAVERADHALQRHNLQVDDPFVLLAPTATGLHKGQIKVWPGFGELAKSLVDRGYRVVTCPPEHERQQAQQAAPHAEMIEPLPLAAFAQLALKAHLVVCNDSGVSHIAALVGARQITLFGVTDPAHTGPWSPTAICLGKLGEWPEMQTVLHQCLLAMESPEASVEHALRDAPAESAT